ncbi:Uncharacterised protein [Vibrio cholerae]|nr:Uncharacterised protein [Vibrio cholerae]
MLSPLNEVLTSISLFSLTNFLKRRALHSLN